MDSITALVDLVRRDEWGAVAEALSPEVHQLVTQWDTLPSDQRGELAGYAVGKHGADILIPGALAKVASKSVKSAQELANVCKNLQIVQETLVLETAAGIGNSAKIGEVIRTGQIMMAIGEDVGLSSVEMSQLKQVGKLQEAINVRLGRLAENEILKLEKQISGWLGEGAKFIRNEAGDSVFLSKDGLRDCPQTQLLSIFGFF